MTDLLTLKNEEIILCSDFYFSSLQKRLLVYFIFAGIIIANLVCLIKMFKEKRRFAVRQRAPYLAMIQVISFLMTILVPVVCEVFSSVNWINWRDEDDATSSSQLDFSRKLAKYTLAVSRLGVSFLTIFR